MNELFHVEQILASFFVLRSAHFDAVSLFNGSLDGLGSYDAIFGKTGSRFKQMQGTTRHHHVVDIFFTEAISFFECPDCVHNVMLKLEKRYAILHNIHGFLWS